MDEWGIGNGGLRRWDSGEMCGMINGVKFRKSVKKICLLNGQRRMGKFLTQPPRLAFSAPLPVIPDVV
jgi:hypothetical protein